MHSRYQTVIDSNLIEASSLDDWWAKMREGYICVQNGNISQIYFMNSELTVFSVAPSSQGVQQPNIRKLEEITHNLNRSVSGNPRHLGFFKAEDIVKERFLNILIKHQGRLYMNYKKTFFNNNRDAFKTLDMVCSSKFNKALL